MNTAGPLAPAAGGKRIVGAAFNHGVGVWDVSTGGRITFLEKGEDRWHDVAVSPDGQRVALIGHDRGTLEVFAAAVAQGLVDTLSPAPAPGKPAATGVTASK